MEGYCDLTCGRCACAEPPPPPSPSPNAEAPADAPMPAATASEDEEMPAPAASVEPSISAAAAAAAAESAVNDEGAAGVPPPPAPVSTEPSAAVAAAVEGLISDMEYAQEVEEREQAEGARAPGVEAFLPCSEDISVMDLLEGIAGTSMTQRALSLAGLTDQLIQNNVKVWRSAPVLSWF